MTNPTNDDVVPASCPNSQANSPDHRRNSMQCQGVYPASNLYPNLIHQSLDPESKKALADFFCEGCFSHKRCINSENVDKYLIISRQLHHEQLRLECENFIRDNNLCGRLSLQPRPANDASRYHVMFANSGSSAGLNAHVYDCRNNFQKTCRVPELSSVGDGAAVCCLQNKDSDAPHVYVSGGGKCTGDVYHCDIVLNKRKKCSKKLVKGRSHHCMKCVQNKLYVLGGRSSNGQTIKTIEEFAPKRHSWKTIGNLEVGVHSAVSVVHGSHIYVFGGVLDNGEETTTVQRFDPQTNSTTLLTRLPFSVSGGQAAVHENTIYIACCNGRLVSYDPSLNQPVVCSNMPTCCSNFAMFVEKEGIFFAGGKTRNDENGNNGDVLKSVYIYSPVNCTWYLAEKDLSSPICVTGACTVVIPAEYGLVPFFN